MSKAKKYYNLTKVEPSGYVPRVGTHRYGLEFKSKVRNVGEVAAIIQLNGSMTGRIAVPGNWDVDPTIGKVLCWCHENAQNPFRTVHCLNLFSYIDPHPKNLSNLTMSALNRSQNDEWIKGVCDQVDYIILAYGDCEGINPIVVKERVQTVLGWFEGKDLYRVGEPTSSGNPQHGRRWNNTPLLQLHRSSITGKGV